MLLGTIRAYSNVDEGYGHVSANKKGWSETRKRVDRRQIEPYILKMLEKVPNCGMRPAIAGRLFLRWCRLKGLFITSFLQGVTE